MHAADRQMHLGVFVLGTGNHIAGWRMDGAFATHMDLPVMQEIARIAERGKFDLLFISDSMAMDPSDHPSFMCRFEPTTLITALAACTRHVGLGATVSTSFSEPFNVARIFGSIDHISGGRAAWNVVTSSNPKAALNFNLDEHIEHELRYARANEYVDVVRGLWDCWDDGAIIADKSSGRYIDAGKVRPGPVLQGAWSAEHGAVSARASGDHSGGWLAVGAGAGCAHGGRCVLGGARAGAGEGGVCQPQRAHGQVWARSGCAGDPAWCDADHWRQRCAGP